MNDYQAENNRLKSLFASGNWSETPSATSCDRIRLDFVREHASAILLSRWLGNVLSWRKLWKTVSEFPGDTEAQLAQLKKKD